MCFVTTLLAALETPETALLRIPIGRPKMLLLNWLDELELDEVLLLPLKSDFRMLVRVVLDESELVVRPSPAMAIWSGAPSHSTAAKRSVAMRRDFDDCEKEEGKCMGWRAVMVVI